MYYVLTIQLKPINTSSGVLFTCLPNLLFRQAFGAKDPPWGPHIVTALLTVLPFAYIGIAARVLTRSNRLGKDDDGVGRAVARGGELIR